MSATSAEKKTEAFARAIRRLSHANVIETAGAPSVNGKPATSDETRDLPKRIKGQVFTDTDAENAKPASIRPAQQVDRSNWRRIGIGHTADYPKNA